MGVETIEAISAMDKLELINSLTIGDIVHIVEEVLPQEAERPITIISLYKNGENFRVTDNTVLYLEVEENTPRKRKYRFWKPVVDKMYGTGDMDREENIGNLRVKTFTVVSRNVSSPKTPLAENLAGDTTSNVSILLDLNLETGQGFDQGIDQTIPFPNSMDRLEDLRFIGPESLVDSQIDPNIQNLTLDNGVIIEVDKGDGSKGILILDSIKRTNPEGDTYVYYFSDSSLTGAYSYLKKAGGKISFSLGDTIRLNKIRYASKYYKITGFGHTKTND